MRGSSHMLTAAATGITIVGTLFWTAKSVSVPTVVRDISQSITHFLIPGNTGKLPIWAFVLIGVFLYFIGSLLPDIDTPYSTLGKILYLPFEHRTWTHALWLPAALCIGGIWVRLLFWMGVGVLVHDFWDSFSASGIHWFYPIGSGKKTKHIALYHTSQPSEFIVVGVALTLAILYGLLSLQLVYHFVNVTFK